MKSVKLVIAFMTLLLAGWGNLQAQNNLGINTATPDASAALDITSTTQGMLVPRMTAAQKTAVVSPAPALMIYQTDGIKGFYYNSGTAAAPVWTAVGSAGVVTDLIANKAGGTPESSIPLATTITMPPAVIYNNVLSAPTIGSYNNATGVYTVGSGGTGVYIIQARIHGNDASPTNNTVSYCLNLVVNNASWGSTAGDIIYGLYTPINAFTPAGTKARGEISTYIKLNAGDAVKIVVHGTNSGVAAQSTIADGLSSIIIMKMN